MNRQAFILASAVVSGLVFGTVRHCWRVSHAPPWAPLHFRQEIGGQVVTDLLITNPVEAAQFRLWLAKVALSRGEAGYWERWFYDQASCPAGPL